MKEIIIATQNKGKIKEFTTLFSKYNITVKSLLDFTEENIDVEETGTTFEENARLKAETIANIINKPVLADDSGLIISYLDGKPGVYSARYAGIDASDEENNEKVLSEMKAIETSKRNAYFICVLAVSIPGEETTFHTGKCHGQIALTPKGTNGFGYDPLFIPEGYQETMAQLTEEKKNNISHRYQAIIQFEAWLDKYTKKGVVR